MLDHDLMLEAGGSSATIQSNPASFVEIILQRAKTTPEAIALNFYTADGYRTSLSYGLLAQRCQAIAAVLQRVTKPAIALCYYTRLAWVMWKHFLAVYSLA